MDEMIIKVVLCIAIPLLLLSTLMDKRGRYLLIGVVFGSVVCIGAYYLNTLVYESSGCSNYYLTTTFAPMIEETLKLIPILLFSLFISREKKDIIPFAFAVGMGFAITENSYMLTQLAGSATIGWMLLRGIGAGLMHGMATLIDGMGIHLFAKSKGLYVIGTMASLFFAMMYHGAYNAMIGADGLKYFGIVIPLISYILVFVFFYKTKIMSFFARFRKKKSGTDQNTEEK